jgi:small-conductance mechanosensitive channel
MLGVTVAALVAIRARSVGTRLVVEGLALLALSGCFVVWGASPLTAKSGQPGEVLWLRALAVVWWLMGARFLASLMALALGRDARSRQARLLSDLVAAAIYLTAALVVLNSVLGLQLRGLVATSGVIAVLLGLASQSTLADVFSGIALGIDQSFRVGDRVSIFDHAEGVIVQMNWRSIRVQTDGEDIAMIPNSIVARSQIINHSVPSPRRAASVDIPVQSTVRSELLMDLIHQAVFLCPALLAEPTPSVSIKYLGARSVTFVASYHVASSTDLGTARGQLLRQVNRLFRHSGVGVEAAPTPGRLLADLVLFESLNKEQIDRLASELIARRLDAGSWLYEQGSAGESMFVVRSGVLEISGDGDRVVGRIGPGEYMGEISMMSGKPQSRSWPWADARCWSYRVRRLRAC